MLEKLLFFIWVVLWLTMSYEDIKYRKVSVIFLVIFFVISLIFTLIKGTLAKNTSDYIFSILKVASVSGMQCILGYSGLADFVFSLAIIQPVSVGVFKVRLVLGLFPTNLQLETSLIEPIYINAYTTLLRIYFLRKLQNKTSKGLIKNVMFFLPFTWIFSVFFLNVKAKEFEVPFIPFFGILVLITSLAHIIIL